MKNLVEKIKKLKYTLDWNLNTKSIDILPFVNDILLDAEKLSETPVAIEPEKTVSEEVTNPIKYDKVVADKINKLWPPDVEPISFEDTKKDVLYSSNNEDKNIKELRAEYKAKFNKNAFHWRDETVLIDKLS